MSRDSAYSIQFVFLDLEICGPVQRFLVILQLRFDKPGVLPLEGRSEDHNSEPNWGNLVIPGHKILKKMLNGLGM